MLSPRHYRPYLLEPMMRRPRPLEANDSDAFYDRGSPKEVSDGHMSIESITRHIIGDSYLNTTDFTRISFVYVRFLPNSAEHDLHAHLSSASR